MGGAASTLSPETFAVAKVEYEAKKGEGLTDEQLFDHMKTFLETMPAPAPAGDAPPAEAEAAPAAEAAPTDDAPPADAAPADA